MSGPPLASPKAPPPGPPSFAPPPPSGPPSAAIVVSTLCGNGFSGFLDGKALTAQFNSPIRVSCDTLGAVYVADPQNNKVRRVAMVGDEMMVTTIGGLAGRGYLDGTATQSQFWSCEGVAADPTDPGTVIVADSASHRIRKIQVDRRVAAPTSDNWNVTTISGDGKPGVVDGPVNVAKFSFPTAIVMTSKGDTIFIDKNSHKIRKIAANGVVSTLAGNGQPGYADGPGIAAQFKNPLGIAVDSSDNIYVADTDNHRIRRISPSGHVVTVAGTGQPGFQDGKAGTAVFNGPAGIAVNTKDEVFCCEIYNHRIRKLSGDGQTVSTVAGQAQPGKEDGDSSVARFNAPRGLACDSSDNIIVADTYNNKIRKVTFVGGAASAAASAAAASNALSTALASLLQTTTATDKYLTLVEGGPVFQLHSALLKARCPKLLLAENERAIAALHLQVPTIQMFLEYVYADRLPKSDAPFYILQGIMACAKICQMNLFVEYLKQRLLTHLTKENAVDFTVYTIDYGLSPELIEFCKSFIIRNFNHFSTANVKTPALAKLAPRASFFNLEHVLTLKANQIPQAVTALEQQVLTNKTITLPPATLALDLKRLFDDEASTDFTIVTSSDANKSSVIRCHKALLFSRWYYFSMLMSAGMKEAAEGSLNLPLLSQYSAELEEIANSAMKKLLLYFYTNQQSHFNDVYDCLYIASSANYFALSDNGQGLGEGYDHSALVKSCLRTASKGVTKDNCINVLNVAHLLHVEEVAEVAKQAVLTNFLDLADNPQLHQLPSPVLSQIYSNLLRKVIVKLQI